MEHHFFDKCLSIISVILYFNKSARKLKGNSEVFKEIPSSLLPSFKRRFSFYVTYNKEKNYKKLYELISNKGFGSDNKPTLEDFMINMRQGLENKKFLNFTPIRIFYSEDIKSYVIEGNAKIGVKDWTYIEERIVHAWHETNNWYFSTFLIRVDD